MIKPVRLVPLAAMFPPSCLNLLFQLVWHLGMLHHLSKEHSWDKCKKLRNFCSQIGGRDLPQGKSCCCMPRYMLQCCIRKCKRNAVFVFVASIMCFIFNTPIILFYLCHIVIRLWLPPKHLVQLDNQAWLSGKLFSTKKTETKKTTEKISLQTGMAVKEKLFSTLVSFSEENKK